MGLYSKGDGRYVKTLLDADIQLLYPSSNELERSGY